MSAAAADNPRSSSAVRNLRSLFENKNSTHPSTSSAASSRGRSAASDDRDPLLRPNSKIRASFVPVEPAPAPGMATSVEEKGVAIPSVAETEDRPAANPDKPVTGAEEEPRELKPADPASADAVSGGEALTTVSEDLRSARSAEKKLAAISTKAPSSAKASPASLKSPAASMPRTPKTETPKKAAVKKASRSSLTALTAPTAASIARAGNVVDKTKTSPAAKPKRRESVKPISVSSHLIAPTAASKARSEAAEKGEAAPSSSSMRASLGGNAIRSKPTTSKPTPRTSLAPRNRAESHSSSTSAPRKPAPAPDSSFLERMTKPTAASQHRSTAATATSSSDKVADPKSPARTKPLPSTFPLSTSTTASKPKTNGKPTSKPSSSSKPVSTPAKPAPSAPAAKSKPTPAAPAANPAPITSNSKPSETPIEPLKLAEQPEFTSKAPAAEAAAPEDHVEPPADAKPKIEAPLSLVDGEETTGDVPLAAPAEPEEEKKEEANGVVDVEKEERGIAIPAAPAVAAASAALADGAADGEEGETDTKESVDKIAEDAE